MTTLCTVEMVCPVCDKAFESRTVVATRPASSAPRPASGSPDIRPMSRQ